MINNYVYQVLPFYDSVNKQNFKQEWMYDDLCSTFLICPENKLLPFQIQRSSRYNPITYINLYCFDGTFQKNLLTDIPANDLKITTAGGIDYISYLGNLDLTNDLDAGFYYVVISDGILIKYSEVFKVICFDFNRNLPIYINSEEMKIGINSTNDISLS